MSLVDWYPTGIEGEVRRIMEMQGHKSPTRDQCKDWVRAFIRKHAPSWKPGVVLEGRPAQKVGAAFEELMVQVRGPLPRGPRQKIVRRPP